jgi:nucleoside-diphosphate-sugar epimerase
MRILVIGGTGFSGPHVVRRLCELGHELALFHRGETNANLPDGVQHVYGDRRHLADFADELRRLVPELVLDMIPFAAQDAWSVVCTFKGIARRVVALSSQDVYRAYGRLIGIERGPIEPVPVGEDAPLRTRLFPYRDRAKGADQPPYHYEKILAERLYMSEPELRGTILRLPMVYGPRDPQHRLFEYLKRMDDGRPAILLAEGMAGWRWTKGYVENVAQAVASAVADDRAAGRVYNVGERETLTEVEWVRAIGRAAGWEGEVIVVPGASVPEGLVPEVDTDQHLVADTARIRQELGYTEEVSCEEGLRRAVAWERGHPPEKIDPAAFDYRVEDKLLAELRERGPG